MTKRGICTLFGICQESKTSQILLHLSALKQAEQTKKEIRVQQCLLLVGQNNKTGKPVVLSYHVGLNRCGSFSLKSCLKLYK